MRARSRRERDMSILTRTTRFDAFRASRPSHPRRAPRPRVRALADPRAVHARPRQRPCQRVPRRGDAQIRLRGQRARRRRSLQISSRRDRLRLDLFQSRDAQLNLRPVPGGVERASSTGVARKSDPPTGVFAPRRARGARRRSPPRVAPWRPWRATPPRRRRARSWRRSPPPPRVSVVARGGSAAAASRNPAGPGATRARAPTPQTPRIRPIPTHRARPRSRGVPRRVVRSSPPPRPGPSRPSPASATAPAAAAATPATSPTRCTHAAAPVASPLARASGPPPRAPPPPRPRGDPSRDTSPEPRTSPRTRRPGRVPASPPPLRKIRESAPTLGQSPPRGSPSRRRARGVLLSARPRVFGSRRERRAVLHEVQFRLVSTPSVAVGRRSTARRRVPRRHGGARTRSEPTPASAAPSRRSVPACGSARPTRCPSPAAATSISARCARKPRAEVRSARGDDGGGVRLHRGGRGVDPSPPAPGPARGDASSRDGGVVARGAR